MIERFLMPLEKQWDDGLWMTGEAFKDAADKLANALAVGLWPQPPRPASLASALGRMPHRAKCRRTDEPLHVVVQIEPLRDAVV